MARAAVLEPVLRVKGRASQARKHSERSPEAKLEEACGLAAAIDLDIRLQEIVTVRHAEPATLFGSGKVDEIKQVIADEAIELVVVDHALSPVQQRNLERLWQVKVVDRTGLILEIFGARARTREGRLQVELAHLNYQKSRLVRSWTHLERQRGGRGGRGFLGGPGETQMEIDRRLIQERIESLTRELDSVRRTRALHRHSRARVPYPIVALVGYTNAGKSTLFNRLTGAEVTAQDMLFATLDPTMRELGLPSGGRIILSDTVGFISDLPTDLVAAFRATLEEVVNADLILHVRDIAHADNAAQQTDVESVLTSLGIATDAPDSRVIEVWNKIDLVPAAEREDLGHRARREAHSPVIVSSLDGEGLAELLALVEKRLALKSHVLEIDIAADQGPLMHWLHENTEIVSRGNGEEGRLAFRVRVDEERRARLLSRLGEAGEDKARLRTL